MSLTTEARPVITAILREMPKGMRGRRALEAEARKLTHDELREVVAFERYLAEEMGDGIDGR